MLLVILVMIKVIVEVLEWNKLFGGIFICVCGGVEIGSVIVYDICILFVLFIGSIKVIFVCFFNFDMIFLF